MAGGRTARAKRKPVRHDGPAGRLAGRKFATAFSSLSVVLLGECPSGVAFLGAGGAEEIRTPDLRRAKAALSQLSYGPSGC